MTTTFADVTDYLIHGDEIMTGDRVRPYKREFFGTRADLEPGIRRLEESQRYRYVLGGSLEHKETWEYASALDIPDLGVSPTDIRGIGPLYLILTSDTDVNLVRKYWSSYVGNCEHWAYWEHVNYREHPGAFVLAPGGLYQNETLISGGCWFKSGQPDDRQLSTNYAKVLMEGFIPVRDPNSWAFYVGPEALEMLKRGVPMQTMGLNYDVLSRDSIPTKYR